MGCGVKPQGTNDKLRDSPFSYLLICFKAEFDIRSSVTGILLCTFSYPLGIKT